jgi:enediyne biosynthesis protein E4
MRVLLKFSSLPAFLCVLFLACNTHTAPTTLFEKIPSKTSGITFVNKVENTEDFNIFSYRNFYNGGGAAIGDLNNDGLSDIFLTSNMGDNKLYLNRGNFRFEDVTEQAGVAGKKFWSTGVTLVDINADGWLDIYVCNAGYNAGEKPENELFINQMGLPQPPSEGGGGTGGIPVFKEEAAQWGLNEDGYSTHAAFFDYDRDGDLDCYILNNSFMPVNTLNYSGNRELYAQDWPVKDFLKGGGDKLLRNDGPPRPPQGGEKGSGPGHSRMPERSVSPPLGGAGGGFVDVTKQANIYGSLIGFGLGVTVGDVNGDEWPDLYISNDFYERDYLYINQQDGTFREEIEQWMNHLSEASMGADMADINNDSYPDIFTTEMLPGDEYRLKTNTLFKNYNSHDLEQQRGFYHQYSQNCLHLNSPAGPGGQGHFRDIAHYAGVAATDWSWGALLFDMDNDGWRDIYVCNGIAKDVIDQDFIDFFADDIIQKMALTGQKEQINEVLNKMPSNPLLNKCFRNTGPSLRFEDVGQQWGFDTPSFSNGAAYGDLDNDGDLDMVINNVNQEAFLYRNNSREITGNHYVAFQLKGHAPNTFAIGAKVWVYHNGKQQTAELVPSRGFQSSVDYKLVFGLGQDTVVDHVLVLWPDGEFSTWGKPQIDALVTLSRDDVGRFADIDRLFDPGPNPEFFEETASPFEAHREDGFVDFYPENLVYHMVSREGPKAAVADVNADGRDDVFIGGATGQPGQLWLQTLSGTFIRTERATFDPDSLYEDTALCFFDADGDHDLDLFVGAGGNAQPLNSRFMQHRLYFNDGRGHFTKNESALPLAGFNTSAAVPMDLDTDGDLDLLVTSRSSPGQYGVPPLHFFYENDGKGKFRNVSRAFSDVLTSLGMVTDAKLVNLVGDAAPELVVVSEWGAPQVFDLKDKQLRPVKTNLSDRSGWWYALESDDVDGDGDQDLILGNRGENFYFSGTAEQPAKLWLGDFDQNGVLEKITTRSVGGRDMPVAMKKELTAQVPNLKKIALRHTDYATKSIQDLFPPERLKNAVVLTGNYFSSAVALNDGNGQFRLIALPKEVQFSSVNAIAVTDLNADGRNDLLLAGNDAGFLPQFSKLDASFGHTLINRGNGEFQWVDNGDSGFFVRGEVRGLKTLTFKGKRGLLATLNDGKPRLFMRK